jgi:hypothetical protein
VSGRASWLSAQTSPSGPRSSSHTSSLVSALHKLHLTTLDYCTQLILTPIPVSLLIGFYTATTSPSTFISRQLPTPPPHPVPPHALILSASIANMFLVQCLLSFLFTVVTREPRLTKYYLAAAAVGDAGHIWASYRFMNGSGVFWDWRAYNDMMVGNVVVSAVLWAMRMGTLGGVFGRVGRR